MAETYRQKIINEVKLLLSGNIIDIDLEPENYQVALTMAFDRYRQRASNSTEESYLFLRLVYEQTEYTLPENVTTVRQLFRRGIGETTGGTQIDPFSLAYTNMYLLQAGAGGGYTAGLLTYELFYQYLDQAGRMFGRDINFTFDPVTKRLSIIRKPTGDEALLVWCYMYKPDESILQNPYSRPWIREYTLAWCKIMLGNAYSKFSQIIGPQGGASLNGEALKNEGQAMIERLEKDLDNYIDDSMPISGIMVG